MQATIKRRQRNLIHMPAKTKSNGLGASAELMRGPSERGPRKCIACGQPFVRGDVWERHSSPWECGERIVIGIHARCK